MNCSKRQRQTNNDWMKKTKIPKGAGDTLEVASEASLALLGVGGDAATATGNDLELIFRLTIQTIQGILKSKHQDMAPRTRKKGRRTHLVNRGEVSLLEAPEEVAPQLRVDRSFPNGFRDTTLLNPNQVGPLIRTVDGTLRDPMNLQANSK